MVRAWASFLAWAGLIADCFKADSTRERAQGTGGYLFLPRRYHWESRDSWKPVALQGLTGPGWAWLSLVGSGWIWLSLLWLQTLKARAQGGSCWSRACCGPLMNGSAKCKP